MRNNQPDDDDNENQKQKFLRTDEVQTDHDPVPDLAQRPDKYDCLE